jgi:hypothetical protein
LRQARQQLGKSLSEEVEAALEEIGVEHSVQFIYDPKEADNLPDYTPQATDWLKQYWQAP